MSSKASRNIGLGDDFVGSLEFWHSSAEGGNIHQYKSLLNAFSVWNLRLATENGDFRDGVPRSGHKKRRRLVPKL